MLNYAILGAGTIAKVMARTVNLMNESGDNCVRLLGIASRSKDKAEAFAREFGIEKAYGSYEELYNDSSIDLVYIATPHNFHFEQCRACLMHGKHVLCEKPFTVNAKEAETLLNLAKEKKLVIAEGIWTRYQPMRRTISEVLAGGIVGKPYLLTANLGYNIVKNERLVSPQLAGGALLDVGVYTLNFANMVFGDATEVLATCVKNSGGVDMSNSITLTYDDGLRMAVLNSSALCQSDRFGMIHCENGYLKVENINNPQSLEVIDSDYKVIKSIKAEKQLTGFEYEVREVAATIESGNLECPSMPHERILYIMRLMDSIRAQLDIKYPFE